MSTLRRFDLEPSPPSSSSRPRPASLKVSKGECPPLGKGERPRVRSAVSVRRSGGTGALVNTGGRFRGPRSSLSTTEVVLRPHEAKVQGRPLGLKPGPSRQRSSKRSDPNPATSRTGAKRRWSWRPSVFSSVERGQTQPGCVLIRGPGVRLSGSCLQTAGVWLNSRILVAIPTQRACCGNIVRR